MWGTNEAEDRLFEAVIDKRHADSIAMGNLSTRSLHSFVHQQNHMAEAKPEYVRKRKEDEIDEGGGYTAAALEKTA